MINLSIIQSFSKHAEPGQVAEPNTINLNVSGDMSKDDVVTEVLNSIKEIEDNQIKLLDGYYKVNNSVFESWKVTGTDIKPKDPHAIYDVPMSVEYGDFGRFLSLLVVLPKYLIQVRLQTK